ncbi:hypothetical protein ASPZODRAFT_1402807 [Penicilliopsis zonata CBS 506.65]|uniref:Uncharacterized protein n=1 Tax=Penicilliopsis zonata CBS 506.65 TaxID=1073090 RepID=A0A1L9SPY6_9EURO|nr:hypothetical protein ASPZODRAFT_1402807 [Penicilliopsis zonata CBS 506.65]OJJ49134.1 hypothetical protein ASPZODRAFT_1402807 [Penicilliopsis zonata CBS 506.65]
MGRDPQPLAIPTRTSSMAAQTTGHLKATRSREEMGGYYDKTSKASKILGEIPHQPLERGGMRDEERKWSRRPSFMVTPEIQPPPKSNRNFDLFPAPAAAEQITSAQTLRVRASSPLLGHDYHSQGLGVPSGSKQKKVHQTGSSSTLYSYFTNHRSRAGSSTSQASGERNGDALPKHPTTPPKKKSSRVGGEPSVSFAEDSRQPAKKESKRKMRPSRIDLSLLFPKPKITTPPLLSPQRMTHSPSPISMVSESPANNPNNKHENQHPPTRKLTKDPPHPQGLSSARDTHIIQRDNHPQRDIHRDTRIQRESHAQMLAPPEVLYASNRQSVASSLDVTRERSVRCSEFDLALKQYHDLYEAEGLEEELVEPNPRPRRGSRQATPSNRSKSNERAASQAPSERSAGAWSKSTHLSPRTKPSYPTRVSSSAENWQTDGRDLASLEVKHPLVKKSSKNALKNSDLHQSSVLCLSSSEDEEEGEEEDHVLPKKSRRQSGTRNNYKRDSVGTYNSDLLEAEIYTAKAIQATRGPAPRRIDKRPSVSDRGSRATRGLSPGRPPSVSSGGKSSYGGQKSSSRRSSGIPTISEPDVPRSPPPHPVAPVPSKELNRRSRIMAVTRQEEDFLEAMRQRKGRITPSLFHEARASGMGGGGDLEQGSMLSVPVQDHESFYGSSDMSFLRLSPGLKTFSNQLEQGALPLHHHRTTDKDAYIPSGEQKTAKPAVSPRTSLIYSESSPSPTTTGGASPLTPTLPIHRFSPLPSQKPPPRRPPPVVPPQDQRRHSRRRTDSSEALVFDEPDEVSPDDFPVWALGWASDRGSTSLATPVH